MRRLRHLIFLAAAVTWDLGPVCAEIEIEVVAVGNAGNAGEFTGEGAGGSGPTIVVGAVDYEYRIGRYEVTNSQYVSFLNAVASTDTFGLYHRSMASSPLGGIVQRGSPGDFTYEVKGIMGNMPVNHVSWYSAVRFANWLHNGQGNGDTETGAYTLFGGTPTPSNGLTVMRNPDAKWFLPSEDEWYKAAYHKNDGVTGNYWDYPTRTDVMPYSDQPPGTDAPDPSNTANYRRNDGLANGYNDGHAVTGSPEPNTAIYNYLTNVGAYPLAYGPYGAYDQGGNVWEWTEALVGLSSRVIRNGAWDSSLPSGLASSTRSYSNPLLWDNSVGFRVASIPEPNGILMPLTACSPFLTRKRRAVHVSACAI